MPNSGSGDPTDPLAPVGAGRSEALTPGADTTAPTAPTAVGGPSAASGVSASDGAAEATSPEAIASALSDGSMDPRTACARLIDQAVQAQLPPDAAPETIAAIRAEVEALVGADPLIERLLRP